ncbi:MAG: hypothetical protein ACOH1T_11950 [Microbacteriaceae bacterium]
MSGGGFPWGLTPGGTPEDDENDVIPPGVPTAPPSDEPIDQGHFVALNPELSLPTPAASWDQPTQATEMPSWDQPTQATEMPSWDQPTQATEMPSSETPDFPAHAPAPWEPPPVDASLLGVTEALSAQPLGFDGLEADGTAGEATSAIDALFGEGSFQEYADDLVPAELAFAANPFASKTVDRLDAPAQGQLVAPVIPKAPADPLPPLQRRLLMTSGVLVAALALVALFLVGTRIAPLVVAPEPEPVVATAQPTLAPEVLGPVAPGDHGWNELLGTECLEPFTSPWEQTFTVVDCGQPHTAQLVFTGTFDDSVLDPYPGFDELQSRMSLLCSTAEGIDYAVAKGFNDIKISASFAATDSAWESGERDYYCFAQRSEGQLTQSIALPDKPKPAIAVTPAPEP